MKSQDNFVGSMKCTRIRCFGFLSFCTVVGFIYFNFTTTQLKSLEPTFTCPSHHRVTTSSHEESSSDGNHAQSTTENPLHRYIRIYNQMGHQFSSNQSHAGADLTMLENLLADKQDPVLSTNQDNYREVQENRKSIVPNQTLNTPNMNRLNNKVLINLAVVACGERKTESLVMLKSAIMFSQDAHLHVILFSDKDTILELAASLLKLKWTVNALGWDFTFELHLDWFPEDKKTEWKSLWVPCSTQRLFFPSLLPHIDSVIYLDTDTIVLSNLTDFWLHFDTYMKDTKIAGLAANNEITAQGWYNTVSKVPYYGTRGLNAGVMLMNLKLMRNFNFEGKSISIHRVYKEKIELADQDILNVLFHGFPELLHLLDCSYNFNWVHCGYGTAMRCHYDSTGESICFCNATFTNGVQILHGNGHTFYNDKYFPFLVQIFKEFQKFDLFKTSFFELFKTLRENFKSMNRPCFPLTEDILYKNVNKYFSTLGYQT